MYKFVEMGWFSSDGTNTKFNYLCPLSFHILYVNGNYLLNLEYSTIAA